MSGASKRADARPFDGLGLSIVVPALDAAATLPATLAAVGGLGAEIVVADGGSADDTVALAEAAGARVVRAPRGRGSQLASGAAAAREWLLFLHADTVPGPGWAGAVQGFVAEPANRRRAAAFRFAVDLEGRDGRWLERAVAWRSRRLALPYGDQGLLIARAFYESLGGFRPLPIMEDVDLVRRIGRRRLAVLAAPLVTSGARYRRAGIVARGLRNLACLGLYFLGVSPRAIARLYG
jgi:rSAM/selenodomain-associated transferase 2